MTLRDKGSTVQQEPYRSFLFLSSLLMIRLVSREWIDHLRVRPARRVLSSVAALVTPRWRLAARIISSLQWRLSRERRAQWKRQQQQQRRFLFRQPDRWRYDGARDGQRARLGRSDTFLPIRLVVLCGVGRLRQLRIGSRRLHLPPHPHLQMGQPDQSGSRGSGNVHHQIASRQLSPVVLQRDWRPNITAVFRILADDDGETLGRPSFGNSRRSCPPTTSI